MAPTLAYLPSVCLETIFSHMPLDDLFRTIGLVCQSWYISLKTVLKRLVRLVLVGGKTQLKLLKSSCFFCPYGNDLIEHVHRDDGSPWLKLKSLDQIMFHTLVVPENKLTIAFDSSVKNLAKITQLTLMYDDVSSETIAQMTRLIEHFSKHLVDLKLSFEVFEEDISDEKEIGHDMANLFVCFNRLLSLRKLRLEISLPLEFLELHFISQLEFLSRLTSFSIYVYGFEDWDNLMLISLRQFGKNIGSIELQKDIQLQDMLQVYPRLDDKFKVLCLDDVSVQDYVDMRRFCIRFRSLTTLNISELTMPMTMLARCLSQLPQLVQLCLELVFKGIPFVNKAQLDNQEAPPQPEIVPVRSVRLLNLNIGTRHHRESDRLFISEIFPNLQVLCLMHRIWECEDCEIENNYEAIRNSGPELDTRLIECKRLLGNHFAVVPNCTPLLLLIRIVRKP